MSGLGPTAEILSFASPKESIQRKGAPDAACFLRAEAFAEGFRKGLPSPSENERHPCRSPNGLFSTKAPVLGAAYGGNPADIWQILFKVPVLGIKFFAKTGFVLMKAFLI
ncbi:hypothetical protein [Methylomonas rosea]|uniref:Uncharacterized protein n=1 Tax=Methylomonas rosea TaxID=2952227 RepID=A0ABT1TND3_9GAMM|nr:hypothetical protein [Methylomonas sp. WSC-7]MCQ8116278.1 hypothetical protein [Methylomonas sp. WSC-7]